MSGKKRVSIIKRQTKETNIYLELEIDGTGEAKISTEAHFFNHMMESFARHSNFNLKIEASGDIERGQHHLIEDIGICLGQAINEALKDKNSINRFGFYILPMDEAEVCVSLDLCGRAFLKYDVSMPYELIEQMETVIIEDFFRALVSNAFITLHITKKSGTNSHHIIEAVFKAAGRAFKQACLSDSSGIIPSTKGSL